MPTHWKPNEKPHCAVASSPLNSHSLLFTSLFSPARTACFWLCLKIHSKSFCAALCLKHTRTHTHTHTHMLLFGCALCAERNNVSTVIISSPVLHYLFPLRIYMYVVAESRIISLMCQMFLFLSSKPPTIYTQNARASTQTAAIVLNAPSSVLLHACCDRPKVCPWDRTKTTVKSSAALAARPMSIQCGMANESECLFNKRTGSRSSIHSMCSCSLHFSVWPLLSVSGTQRERARKTMEKPRIQVLLLCCSFLSLTKHYIEKQWLFLFLFDDAPRGPAITHTHRTCSLVARLSQ